MGFITLASLILTILSFMYLFLIGVNKYVFQQKIKDFKLKVIISFSFVILFWLLTYSLNAVHERIQNPYINSNNIEEYSGTLGDLVGGTLNPILGLFGIIVGGLAFYAQYQANKQVQEQFKIQQFESQLYQMIELYRKNADEMKIAKHGGRKCFAVMLEEFKFIYLETEIYLSEYSLNEKDLTSITYCIFYYGVGNNLKTILDKNYNLLNINFAPLVYRLEMIKSEFDYQNYVTLINDYGETVYYIFKYKPFKGHLSRLGHYYRHLFQTVKYIINQQLEYKEKYKYLKLLRSQISDYEYIFLFYNSLFEKGNDWLLLDIFTEYRFIKNIPLELLNFGLNPKDLFEETNSRNEKIFE